MIEYSEIREIEDYPNEDGVYYVIEVDSDTGNVVEVTSREFTTWDEDCMTQYSGWEDIQYMIDNPEIYGRTSLWRTKYYWCKEMKLK